MNRGDGLFVVLLAPTEFPSRSTNRPGTKAYRSDGQIGITQSLRFHFGFFSLVFMFPLRG